jgi:hypothetical protein
MKMFWKLPHVLYFTFSFPQTINKRSYLKKKNPRKMALYSLLYSVFWGRVSPCSPGWPWTHDPPASVSWVLGLQVRTTMPGSVIRLDHTIHLIKIIQTPSDTEIHRNGPVLIWSSVVSQHVTSPQAHFPSKRSNLVSKRIWKQLFFSKVITFWLDYDFTVLERKLLVVSKTQALSIH